MGAVMPEVLRYYYKTALIVKLNKSLSTPLADILVLKRKSMMKTIYLFNVYSPNNDNHAAQFYDHLLAMLQKEDLAYEDKIIIGGDFNCPLNPILDKQGVC